MYTLDDRFDVTPAGRHVNSLPSYHPERDRAGEQPAGALQEEDFCSFCDSENCRCSPRYGLTDAGRDYDQARCGRVRESVDDARAA